jgi:hypothetical protein
VPPTLIVDSSLDFLTQLKAALLSKQIRFNDGYEHLAFSPWYFNSPPVINLCTTPSGKPNDKIGQSSYSLRLLARSTYERFYDFLECPDTFISTGAVNTSPRSHPDCYQRFHLAEVASHDILLKTLT